MITSKYANLHENKSGFWVEKLYSGVGKCSYLVHHQCMTEFRDSISEAKNNLRDRYKKKVADRQFLLENWILSSSPLVVRPQPFAFSQFIRGI